MRMLIKGKKTKTQSQAQMSDSNDNPEYEYLQKKKCTGYVPQQKKYHYLVYW